MTTTFNAEYLGLAPGIDDGLGVGLISFRNSDVCLTPFSFCVHRAALERLRDDIDRLLGSECALNNDRTRNKAMRERVVVQDEVLDGLGLFDIVYKQETD